MADDEMSNGNVVEMTDINCANSETPSKNDSEDTNHITEQKTTTKSQNEDDDKCETKDVTVTQLEINNGNNRREDSDLLARRKRETVASMRIPNVGIQHDDVCVQLTDADEGDDEDEGDGDKKKEVVEDEDEIQVSSPMMMDKPAEMRPYSIAVDVMFTRKETKSKRKKMCLISLAILLAVLLIGGIIAVLVVFLGNTQGPEPELVAIQGEFRLSDRVYSSAYTDSNSQEYQDLQQEFITEMDTIFTNGTYQDIYIKTDVSGFRPGSIIVAFLVQLKRMANEMLPPNDGSTTDPDEDNQSNDVIYSEARDFIFTSTKQGMLGKLTGKVISLTLVLGDGKPAQRVTPTPTTPPMYPITTTTSKISTTTSSSSMTTTSTISTSSKDMPTTTMPTTTVAGTSTPMVNVSAATAANMNNASTPEPDISTNNATMTTGPGMSSIFTDVVTMETKPDTDSSMSFSSSSDYDPCDPNPCMHGATCVYFLGAFCQCSEGYYGTICEHDNPPDLCDPNPCLNAGNCTAFSQQTHCTCPDEFYGDFCERATMSYISYDYSYDSSVIDVAMPIPIPGDMFECKPVGVAECLDILPFNMSTVPNPHGLGNSMSDIQNQFDMLSVHINNQCHPDSTRVLCSLLHTKCTADTSNLFMAFLETYIPCRSLCLEIDDRCLANGGPISFTELCDALPESADSSVCYRSPSTTGPLSCTSDYCQNNGSCLVIMNQTMCRCAEGFVGMNCETRDVDPCLSNPCQSGGECQPEPPALPGASLIYVCVCQSGFFGKHCENMDENAGMVDVPKVPTLSECGRDIIIAECADRVPYNISYSAAVNVDSYNNSTMEWGAILSQADMCHEDADAFVCAVIQRKCTEDGTISPCRTLCERVAHCDISSSALPYNSRNCETYSDSFNSLDCFDVNYNG